MTWWIGSYTFIPLRLFLIKWIYLQFTNIVPSPSFHLFIVTDYFSEDTLKTNEFIKYDAVYTFINDTTKRYTFVELNKVDNKYKMHKIYIRYSKK